MESNSIDFSQLGFIIGAGAHVPYDMPVSKELTAKIKKLNHPKITIEDFSSVININPFRTAKEGDEERISALRAKKEICRVIHELGLINFEQNVQNPTNEATLISQTVDKFLDAFAGSQLYSIDAYLAKYLDEHPNEDQSLFTQIGKIILIYFISKDENATPIGHHGENWIQFLINEYFQDKKSRDQFFSNPPKIYTFNYDRLLEKSLMSHLIDFHSIEKQTAIDMVKSLKIHHIYGDLGAFEHTFSFKNLDHIKEAMSSIRVIGEERLKTTEDLSAQIFGDLNKLKRVYLLGYGYDPLNNKLLFSHFNKFLNDRKMKVPPRGRPHPLFSFPEFVSTNIKLSEVDMRKIQNELIYLNIKLGYDGTNINNIDSYKLISEKYPFHQAFKTKHAAIVPGRSNWVTDY